MKRRKIAGIVPLACFVLLGGCGTSSKTTSTATPGATTTKSAATVPNALLGTYKRRVTRADIERTASSRHEGPGQTTPTPGPALLVIGKSTWTLIDPTARPPLSIEEDVTITAPDRVSINGYVHPDMGTFCGPEVPQNAAYNSELAGKLLRLSALNDRCADRDSTLTGTWKRQP
jgi:hypothetical protein